MRRISVVGASGSGKSTISRVLAARLGLDHIELDSIHHQAGWTPLPRDELRARLSERLAGGRWIVDGNYQSSTQDLVWSAADTVVWLDLGRLVTLRAIVARTIRRITTREVLWNGNRERWSNFFDPRPIENVILWSWTRHPRYRREYERASVDPAHGHLRFVRLRTRAAVQAFLCELPAASSAPVPSRGEVPCP